MSAPNPNLLTTLITILTLPYLYLSQAIDFTDADGIIKIERLDYFETLWDCSMTSSHYMAVSSNRVYSAPRSAAASTGTSADAQRRELDSFEDIDCWITGGGRASRCIACGVGGCEEFSDGPAYAGPLFRRRISDTYKVDRPYVVKTVPGTDYFLTGGDTDRGFTRYNKNVNGTYRVVTGGNRLYSGNVNDEITDIIIIDYTRLAVVLHQNQAGYGVYDITSMTGFDGGAAAGNRQANFGATASAFGCHLQGFLKFQSIVVGRNDRIRRFSYHNSGENTGNELTFGNPANGEYIRGIACIPYSNVFAVASGSEIKIWDWSDPLPAQLGPPVAPNGPDAYDWIINNKAQTPPKTVADVNAEIDALNWDYANNQRTVKADATDLNLNYKEGQPADFVDFFHDQIWDIRWDMLNQRFYFVTHVHLKYLAVRFTGTPSDAEYKELCNPNCRWSNEVEGETPNYGCTIPFSNLRCRSCEEGKFGKDAVPEVRGPDPTAPPEDAAATPPVPAPPIITLEPRIRPVEVFNEQYQTELINGRCIPTSLDHALDPNTEPYGNWGGAQESGPNPPGTPSPDNHNWVYPSYQDFATTGPPNAFNPNTANNTGLVNDNPLPGDSTLPVPDKKNDSDLWKWLLLAFMLCLALALIILALLLCKGGKTKVVRTGFDEYQNRGSYYDNEDFYAYEERVPVNLKQTVDGGYYKPQSEGHGQKLTRQVRKIRNSYERR